MGSSAPRLLDLYPTSTPALPCYYSQTVRCYYSHIVMPDLWPPPAFKARELVRLPVVLEILLKRIIAHDTAWNLALEFRDEISLPFSLSGQLRTILSIGGEEGAEPCVPPRHSLLHRESDLPEG